MSVVFSDSVIVASRSVFILFGLGVGLGVLSLIASCAIPSTLNTPINSSTFYGEDMTAGKSDHPATPALSAIPVTYDTSSNIRQKMEGYQWAVITHNGNDEETEIFDRFSDAFSYSQPDNQEDGVDWRYTRRAEISDRFIQGENDIRVAWSAVQPDTVFVIIRRY